MKRSTLKHARRVAKAKQEKAKLALTQQATRKTIRTFGDLAGIYQSKRGNEYFGWHMKIFDLMGNFSVRVVPVHTLRLKVLRECSIWAAEAVDKNELKSEDLEIVLDYLFAELNTRLNKEPKSV